MTIPHGIEKIATIRLMELAEAGEDLGKSLDEYCAYTRQFFPVCELPLSCQILFSGEYRLAGLRMYSRDYPRRHLIRLISISISDLAWALVQLHLTPDHLIEMIEPLYRLQLTHGDEQYLHNLRDTLCNYMDETILFWHIRSGYKCCGSRASGEGSYGNGHLNPRSG
jgi:hypothetical protein